MNFIGIDTGKSGGIALIHVASGFCTPGTEGTVTITTMSLKDATERDVWLFVKEARRGCSTKDFGVIEKVHSSPQMGVVSSFTFGKSYGFLRGVLTGSGMAFDEVSPQKWQKYMGCLTKGDKNISKAKAQQLFPNVKITHANADALLLAEYCRRTRI